MGKLFPAWETTEDDIAVVLDRHGYSYKLGDGRIVQALDLIDAELVASSALFGREMEEQTVFAYQEIERQLAKVGYIEPGFVSKFTWE